MPVPTVTASSSASWVLTPAAHNRIAELDAIHGAGFARARLFESAAAKQRLSVDWRPQVTSEKLARPEEVPRSCRQLGQATGLLAEFGHYLSLLQLDVLTRFGGLWAKQHNDSVALGRYTAMVQTSRTHFVRTPTKLEELYVLLEKGGISRQLAKQIGCALNIDGKAKFNELDPCLLRSFADKLIGVSEKHPDLLQYEDK